MHAYIHTLGVADEGPGLGTANIEGVVQLRHMPILIHTYTYIYTHTCTYTIYIHTYIHTHIHIPNIT